MSVAKISNHPDYSAKIHPDALGALNKLRNAWEENSERITAIQSRMSTLPLQVQGLVAQDILRVLASNWNEYETLVLQILKWDQIHMERSNVEKIDTPAANDDVFKQADVLKQAA